MQNYNYTGINQLGKRVSGVMPANNEQELEQKLRKSQIDLLNCRASGKGLQLSFGTKVKKRDIITITFQLEQMLQAGVPLMEIIEEMKNTFENDAVKEMLANIYEAMEGGNTFSEALQDFKKEFGQVYISLVSVGEKTGKLEDILRDLGNMMKWEDELASKAKKVMIYPSIVATVVIAVVI